MKKIAEIVVMVVTLLFCIQSNAIGLEPIERSGGGLTGHLGATIFPKNDEHDTPATLESYVQYENKDIFVFTEFMFNITDQVPERVRTDNRYITTMDLKVGYLSNVQLGIGYNLNKSFDARLIYIVQREPEGYEGDWTGIQIRWNFGR